MMYKCMYALTIHIDLPRLISYIATPNTKIKLLVVLVVWLVYLDNTIPFIILLLAANLL